MTTTGRRPPSRTRTPVRRHGAQGLVDDLKRLGVRNLRKLADAIGASLPEESPEEKTRAGS